jgi:hypothetical protein
MTIVLCPVCLCVACGRMEIFHVGQEVVDGLPSMEQSTP